MGLSANPSTNLITIAKYTGGYNSDYFRSVFSFFYKKISLESEYLILIKKLFYNNIFIR